MPKQDGSRTSKEVTKHGNVTLSTHNSRKRTVLIVVLIVIVGVLVWCAVNHFSIGKNAMVKCSTKVINDANSAVQSKNYVENLRPVVNRIQNIDGFDKDVNCLYFVTFYYIQTSDYKNSHKYLSELTKLYSSPSDLNKSIEDPQSPQTFKDQVKFLKKQTSGSRGIIYEGPQM